MAVFNNILNGASGQTGGAADYQIERSLRFNRNDSAYLSRTPSSAGNRRTWTWSGWVKLSSEDRKVLFAQTTNTASQFFILEHRNNVLDIYDYNGGVYNSNLSTSRVFRDYSAWYHIVFTYDTTNSTADDRQRLYVNGEQITSFGSRTNPSQNFEGFVNTAAVHYLSGYTSTGTLPHDGYMAEVHFIDGQSLQASDFGEYDDNNVWQPKEYSGTYGTNGWYLNFSDATNTTTIAEDSSGNGNNWTATNISVTAGAGNDSLLDSPTNGTQTDTGAGGEVSGNYCTLNDVFKSTNGYTSISNGGLEVENTSAFWTTVFGTTALPSSGKWYWEATNLTANILFGIVSLDSTNITADNFFTASSISHGFYPLNGNVNSGPGNSSVSYSTALLSTDYIGVALDMDAGELTFYKNGSSLGVAKTGLTGNWIPALSLYNTGYNYTVNFGQRPFSYSAPSGFKALCTANLDTPTIEDGSTAMDVALYTGNGSTQTISGLGFSPDLVWIKSRSNGTDWHALNDTVRGAGQSLYTNVQNSEDGPNYFLSSFTSDGFSVNVNPNDGVNTTSDAYVGWTWDAGTSTVSNTDGSITSSVRANPSAGFSIVSYTGVQSAATVGHGLNAAPGFIVVKSRSNNNLWAVYHSYNGKDKYMVLNGTFAVGTISNYWGTTGPNSTTFGIWSGGGAINTSGNNHIAYCWAPVEGYSSFGSYTGNGSTDGPCIYTGFKPRWILVKSNSTIANWFVVDTERDPDNLTTQYLIPNLANAEGSTLSLDILSNGFKWRASSTGINASGTEYIYAAFAEHPFKTARAR